MSSIEINNLNQIIFVNQIDIDLNNHFEFTSVEGDLFIYKNKINDNLTYFSHKLVDLNNIDSNSFIILIK